MVKNKIHSILEIKEQKTKRIRLVSRNKMPYNFLYCKKNEKYIPWHIYCFQSFIFVPNGLYILYTFFLSIQHNEKSKNKKLLQFFSYADRLHRFML
ncbi:MAG: hypothetical protein D3905_00360 [Candidatus Electrothrix sp. AS4_5]|nr:hypothetical protein [Candidatus Electrothrix gigas]